MNKTVQHSKYICMHAWEGYRHNACLCSARGMKQVDSNGLSHGNRACVIINAPSVTMGDGGEFEVLSKSPVSSLVGLLDILDYRYMLNS